MSQAINLGFPRIGLRRELKRALEEYWKGAGTQESLLNTARELRHRHWDMQRSASIHHIPCNDFALYDQMLDMSILLGCVPARFGHAGGNVPLDVQFAMARGSKAAPAMEMTKWFDTNYHYIVPEFTIDQDFALSSHKIFDEFLEARAVGITSPRPVLIGPVTYLSLGKAKGAAFDPIDLLPRVLPVYETILKQLAEKGAEWVQMDEPIATLDLSEKQKAALKTAYDRLSKAAPLKIAVATYFEGLRDNGALVAGLPIAALHIDAVRGRADVDAMARAIQQTPMILSVGIIDGRNIWRNDLSASLDILDRVVGILGKDRVWVGPSSSLLHSPIDLTAETTLDAELKSWMAFGVQKLDEIAVLAKGVREGRASIAPALAASRAALDARAASPRIHARDVKARVAAITPAMAQRQHPFAVRQQAQQAKYNLPLFPTTTIGSFPQTKEIRTARADFKAGRLTSDAYEQAMRDDIKNVVAFQDSIGIDVPVHGEAERNDMVEYFGEQLAGFAFTKNGWVQSYGSRCVKPPIIIGDVSRPHPMTVAWSRYAQSLTAKPMKGMLTGPITILQWSFVRDDQPRSQTCKQIALAIRDEVQDLEAAGITIIQIDEPAIREGLPLRRADWADYLAWAVESFKLSSCGVADTTQIHTHMCYSEFNDIMDSIAALDADVISIETSRSQMELLEAFVTNKYPNEIGPGVYDIHSPRVPTRDEMIDLLQKARHVLSDRQIWVNPDCGLKTRGWAEVTPALTAMIEAAQAVRSGAKASAAA